MDERRLQNGELTQAEAASSIGAPSTTESDTSLRSDATGESQDPGSSAHVLTAAADYVARGRVVIPIPYRSKAPILRDWQKLRLTKDELPDHFKGPCNVGVLLGEPSGNLIDIDLDAPEARELARFLLSPTAAKFGRASSRASHWLYTAEGAGRRKAYRAPSGDMLVEIRASGAQTVFPPSRHPTGEAIQWEPGAELDPAAVKRTDLDRAVGRLAAAALIVRHWPSAGSRHEFALALAGALLSSGISQSDTEDFVEIAARAAGDDETADRVNAVRSTAKRLAQGEPVTGLPRLGELIGEREARCIADWLGLKYRPTAVTADRGLSSRPVIRVVRGGLPRVLDKVEEKLLAEGLDLYQRGSKIVRPADPSLTPPVQGSTPYPRLHEVSAHHLTELIDRTVVLERQNAKGDWIQIDCPLAWAEKYLGRVGRWRLPCLTAIINAPTLRPDGSILGAPGYDSATGLLYQPQGQPIDPMPQSPTREDARQALDTLIDLISGFPFVTLEDRSVELSAILTAIVRPAIETAPLHAFTAPTAGTGKSLLVDVAAMIATGRPAATLEQGRDDQESSKRIGASLIAGDPIISIDNCAHPLGGEQLCQALTQRHLRIRKLGHSQNVDVLSTAAFFSTGNNLVIDGDMTRRVLLCSLDARVERPEHRTFSFDPVDLIRRHRARYVGAALTVMRAFIVAGSSSQANPLGSFAEWSSRVRDCLIWLGEPDPCLTMQRARASDPKREAIAQVVHPWGGTIGTNVVTAKELFARARGDLREALITVAGDRGGNINMRRLGKWLAANQGKFVDGLRIIEAGSRGGVRLWRLEREGPSACP